MTIEDQIKDEKLQYDINREAVKISALSSGKIDKYEYLSGEEILPSNQRQIIEQAKFTYSPLGKAFEKQTKTIEDQGKKQVDALTALKTSNKKIPSIKDFIPIENLNPEIINEIKRIEEIEKYVDRDKNNVISMTTANTEQANLLSHIEDFIKKTKPRGPMLKKLKEDVLTSVLSPLKGREMVYKAFESGIFQKLEESQQEGEGLKILTPNQMLKRLSIALAK